MRFTHKQVTEARGKAIVDRDQFWSAEIARLNEHWQSELKYAVRTKRLGTLVFGYLLGGATAIILNLPPVMGGIQEWLRSIGRQ